ncbi:hypothetical protein ONA02_05380 [Mycoplasmopsis felis]|uniref:hypothetical protein n=1 Tax=Mycoplasmopsis felis TaxID=33923 RepID=UPI0022863CFA|nr:hypothetical protein [Mycoplasmopsis felis]WAM02022.1 hypothetical protein ONA02_05380 [Mycoplasmopsis felis]
MNYYICFWYVSEASTSSSYNLNINLRYKSFIFSFFNKLLSFNKSEINLTFAEYNKLPSPSLYSIIVLSLLSGSW